MNVALYGVLAEYPTAEAMLAAVPQVRGAGVARIDAYAPFAVEGLADALDFGASGVAPWAFAGGAVAGAGAYFLQWYAAVISYPLNIGGRPLHSWPAFIPITFELSILGAALAALLAMLVLNGLPSLAHPLFAVPAFELASRNRYYLVVRADPPGFDAAHWRAVLERSGAQQICEVPR